MRVGGRRERPKFAEQRATRPISVSQAGDHRARGRSTSRRALGTCGAARHSLALRRLCAALAFPEAASALPKRQVLSQSGKFASPPLTKRSQRCPKAASAPSTYHRGSRVNLLGKCTLKPPTGLPSTNILNLYNRTASHHFNQAPARGWTFLKMLSRVAFY